MALVAGIRTTQILNELDIAKRYYSNSVIAVASALHSRKTP